MNRFAGLIAAVTLASSPAIAQAPADSKAQSESLSYDKAVAKVWGHLNSVQYVVDWCSKNVRSSKAPVQKAYKQWNTRFADVITDVNRRIDEVMNPGGQVPAKEFGQRKADLLKRGAERFAQSMTEQPAADVQQVCTELPQRFEEVSFDLEKLFASELRLIRQRSP
jgi:ABC-type uncharacterized transport system YnjBCD substrate-binding protein